MPEAPKQKIRCAIYTRKSTDEGLEQEFNSLDAQREAGEAYIASQRHEGWLLVPDAYDDGGYSGGNVERPALKRLLTDIEAGKINVVVVYKVDRLSRSLADFAKLVEVFDRHGVSFVSVTQQFNTTTSMGRLTLNILLSFAQFEREVIGERIRDKFAASKRKGMWMGGCPPLGYDIRDRKLIINEAEADQVRHTFRRFLVLRSTTRLVNELRTQGIRSKTFTTKGGKQRYGKPMTKNQVYRLLNNRIYLGEIPHKDKSFPGQHEAIIERKIWDQVHEIIGESPRQRARQTLAKDPALLKGLVRCGGCDGAMTPVHTRKEGRKYFYYKPSQQLRGGCHDCPVNSIPAGELEGIVVGQLQQIFIKPEIIVKTWAAAHAKDASITEDEVRRALMDIGPVWNELFPLEQARIVNLLIEKIRVDAEGVDIHMRASGLEEVAKDLASARKQMETTCPA